MQKYSRFVVTALGILWLAAARPAAQGQGLTLAWDPNSDPFVLGYLVYVGTEPGNDADVFDVGSSTSFDYPHAVPGRRYYFSVAAYTEGRLIGSRSAEISAALNTSGPRSSSPAEASQLAVGSTVREPVPDPAPALVCSEPDGSACYAMRSLARGLSSARSLRATGDGRALFLEDDEVRVLAGDRLVERPALTPRRGTSLTGLAVDPAFRTSRFVFVGEAVWMRDGTRELSIVRYREVNNTLGEGAPVVVGVPLPAAGDAPFAVDSAGRIYVAVPGAEQGALERTPYAAMVLRFNGDGSVPRDSRGASPIYARGFTHPFALAWDESGNRLWMGGDAGAMSILDLDRADLASEWPLRPRALKVQSSDDAFRTTAFDLQSTPVAAAAAGAAIAGSSSGRVRLHLGRITIPESLRALELEDARVPASVTLGMQGELYVILRTDSGASEIVALLPVNAPSRINR